MQSNKEGKKKLEFVFEGKQVSAEFRDRAYSDARRTGLTKTLAFVTVSPEPSDEEIREVANRLGLDTIYTERGKYPEVDRAFDRMNRRIIAEKRAVLEAALRRLVGGLEALELQFSRQAGCGCGCSPGFRIKGMGAHTLFISATPVKH